jgi:hypothetical protein
MSDHNPHKDMARGAQAEALLANELLVEAFNTLDAEYNAAWRNSGARDTEGRERLWQAIQILSKVQLHLKFVIEDGKIAKRQLEEIEKLGSRAKIFGIV